MDIFLTNAILWHSVFVLWLTQQGKTYIVIAPNITDINIWVCAKKLASPPNTVNMYLFNTIVKKLNRYQRANNEACFTYMMDLWGSSVKTWQSVCGDSFISAELCDPWFVCMCFTIWDAVIFNWRVPLWLSFICKQQKHTDKCWKQLFRLIHRFLHDNIFWNSWNSWHSYSDLCHHYKNVF